MTATSDYAFGTDFSAAFAVATGSPEGTLLELLKAYLGIDPGDVTKDAELSQAINMAGDFIETYLDRVVALREVNEYFPHHFGTVILHHYPVDTAQGVVVTLNGDAQSGYTVWRGRDNLGHLSRTGMRQDTPMDWRRYDQVDVTYTAGFDPIPSDLANCIIWTAADLYNSQGTGSIPGGGGSGEIKGMTIYDVGSITYDVGSSSSGGGDGTFTGGGVIPATVQSILTRYKRMSV